MTRPRGGHLRNVESDPAARRRAVEEVRCHDVDLFPAGQKTATLDGGERFIVTVEAAGGGWRAVSPLIRLRRWIKSASRCYGLRVRSVRRERADG